MDQSTDTPTYARKLPAEFLTNCRVLPDRNHILNLLPQGKIWCEVGVALGEFSKSIIDKCKVSKFYAIDIFVLHNAPQVWGGRVGRELGERKHIDYYRDRFKPEIDSGVMEVLKGDSFEMLKRLPPKGVDMFYVDANHSYTSVKNELSIIKEKIATTGMIILNDYIMADWLTNTKYGVVQATHEFMIEEKWEMIYFALHTGMFCDVALRKL